MIGFGIVEPRTLDEAFSLLTRDDPAVRPIGGGTALMLMMKAGLFQPLLLVSLRRIEPNLAAISLSADRSTLRIGAMAPFAALEHSPEIQRLLPVVAPTMRTLANVRVRNVATVGGNLAHADPHLDLPPVWIALGARAEIASRSGTRLVAVEDLFTGYYETVLKHDELITAIDVPVRPGRRASYSKVTTRAAHDWPALGIAIALDIEGGVVTEARIALGAATAKATRLTAAEAVLRGARIDRALLRRVGEAAASEARIETDDRGSAEYKKHLLRVHLGRAVDAIAGERL